MGRGERFSVEDVGGRGRGWRWRQVRLCYTSARQAGRLSYGFLAVEGFFLLRRGRDCFRLLRHAGSIDQIRRSDQDPFDGKAEGRMQNEEGGGSRTLAPPSISNWRFQISEGPGKDRRDE